LRPRVEHPDLLQARPASSPTQKLVAPAPANWEIARERECRSGQAPGRRPRGLGAMTEKTVRLGKCDVTDTRIGARAERDKS
jgi:hypothetical protein